MYEGESAAFGWADFGLLAAFFFSTGKGTGLLSLLFAGFLSFFTLLSFGVGARRLGRAAAFRGVCFSLTARRLAFCALSLGLCICARAALGRGCGAEEEEGADEENVLHVVVCIQ
jgi:hypothetical protein